MANSVSRETVIQENEMYEELYSYAERNDLKQTLQALPFARQCHEGQLRSGKTRIPYFCHPLTVCSHALALGFTEDLILATALLHDVCEDCGVSPEALPAGDEVRHAVQSLTRSFTAEGLSTEGRKKYYEAVAENPAAAIVKILDRCNNISTMVDAFPRKKMAFYVKETEQLVYPLFDKVLEYYPDRRNQIMLIRYHMDSVMTAIRHELKR